MNEKNIWEIICEQLGIEPSHPFAISSEVDDLLGKDTQYKILMGELEIGLYVKFKDETAWRKSDLSLNTLFDKYTIITQKPWKPTLNEMYYYVYWVVDVDDKIAHLDITNTNYVIGHAPDTLKVTIGNCFRTKEQARRNKYKLFERLADMTWDEWCAENGYKDAEKVQD